MADIIYFHGFASSGTSNKSQALALRFGSDHVLSPDLPSSPQQVLELADRLIRSRHDHPIVLVGTSLGGFWANYLAHKYDIACVLVNPCVSPSTSLRKYLDRQVQNYKSGDSLTVTSEDLDFYRGLEQQIPNIYNGYLVNLFLAKDDDVLPYQDTLQYFTHTRDCVLTDDGGHRYSTHWGQVLDRVAVLAAD